MEKEMSHTDQFFHDMRNACVQAYELNKNEMTSGEPCRLVFKAIRERDVSGFAFGEFMDGEEAYNAWREHLFSVQHDLLLDAAVDHVIKHAGKPGYPSISEIEHGDPDYRVNLRLSEILAMYGIPVTTNVLLVFADRLSIKACTSENESPDKENKRWSWNAIMDNIPRARLYAFEKIHVERVEQDKQWGGPEHDDHHAVADWERFIRKQLDKAGSHYQRMKNIAALAVAALEQIDRNAGNR